MNKLNGKITTSATMRGALTRSAGGGTYVEANPEGEPTDILEKLMVESDIFEIRNVPDTASAHNGDVLTKTANGVEWSAPPETDVIYSTEEQEIGAWIDGSPIYQKTVVLNNLSLRQGSNNFALSSFNIFNVKYVIGEPSGFLKVNANDIRTYPFGSTYSLRVYVTPTNLVIERTGNSLSLEELTATITYTKEGD